MIFLKKEIFFTLIKHINYINNYKKKPFQKIINTKDQIKKFFDLFIFSIFLNVFYIL